MKTKYLLLPLIILFSFTFVSAGECSEFNSVETCVLDGCSWESQECSDIGYNFELCESEERVGCFYGGCEWFDNSETCNAHLGCNWEEIMEGIFGCGGAGYCGGVYNETCVGTYTTQTPILGVITSNEEKSILTGQTIQEEEIERIGFWQMFSNFFQNLFGRIRGIFK